MLFADTFRIGIVATALISASCAARPDPVSQAYPTPAGADLVILDSAQAAAIFPESPVIEKLTGDVFGWSEGPVWVKEGGYLLFTDVPGNTIHKWSEAGGLETFLQPSGFGGEDSEGIFREPGANGLISGDRPGTILLGDHGNRAIARLDLTSRNKDFLAADFEGQRFSSPNDLVLARDGSIYFTDPPYGLAGLDESPFKETDFNGVYRWHPSGPGNGVQLVDDSLTRPNGVILSPDGATLYVAVSDPEAARIFAYMLDTDGLPTERRLFADLTPMVGPDLPGLPDGMAVDMEGRLYATGPGGVHVFLPDGTPVARISTGTAAANCAFGDDGRTLYITSGSFLARIRLAATGLGFEAL